jgi:hypothetical protein
MRLLAVATLVIPFLAAGAMLVHHDGTLRRENFFLCSMRFDAPAGFAAGPPPRSGEVPPPTGEVTRAQAGAPGLVLPAALVLVLGGLVLGVARRLSGRRISPHLRRLPARIGLLALLLALAAAAFAEASDLLTLWELGSWRHWLDSDRATTPWGSLVLIVGGVAVAGVALVSSAVLEHVDGRTRR